MVETEEKTAHFEPDYTGRNLGDCALRVAYDFRSESV